MNSFPQVSCLASSVGLWECPWSFQECGRERVFGRDRLLSLLWLIYQGLMQYRSLKPLHLNSLPHASLDRSSPSGLEALYVAHAPAVVS